MSQAFEKCIFLHIFNYFTAYMSCFWLLLGNNNNNKKKIYACISCSYIFSAVFPKFYFSFLCEKENNFCTFTSLILFAVMPSFSFFTLPLSFLRSRLLKCHSRYPVFSSVFPTLLRSLFVFHIDTEYHAIFSTFMKFLPRFFHPLHFML